MNRTDIKKIYQRSQLKICESCKEAVLKKMWFVKKTMNLCILSLQKTSKKIEMIRRWEKVRNNLFSETENKLNSNVSGTGN